MAKFIGPADPRATTTTWAPSDRVGHPATIGIVTRNRSDALHGAIASALAQEPPVPVVVLDDASTDGTADMVRTKFPEVPLIHFREQIGYIEGRMLILRQVTTPLVCFLDDDAAFSAPSVIRDTVADFDHPRVAAVAVPLRESGAMIQGAPGTDDFRLTDFFIGAAFAVRRDVVLALGGMRTKFFFYVEESDLCIRLLEAGFVTRVGRSAPVIHSPYPGRDKSARFAQLIKNELLFKWYHTPSRILPMVIAGHVLGSATKVPRGGSLRAFAKGIYEGGRGLLDQRKARRPVDLETYRNWRRLRRERSIPFEQMEPHLPAIREDLRLLVEQRGDGVHPEGPSLR